MSGRAARDSGLAASATLTPFSFDVLHVDGRDLLDAPLRQRLAVLDQVATPHVVGRVVTSEPAVAADHFASVIAAARCSSGRRGFRPTPAG